MAGEIGNPIRACAERLQLLEQGDLSSPVPVSYTHLDVYKRQGLSKSSTPTEPSVTEVTAQ